MKEIIVITTLMAMLVTFMIFIEKRDQKLIKSSERYENCIQKEYKTTPSAWYMEYGYYPECKIHD